MIWRYQTLCSLRIVMSAGVWMIFRSSGCVCRRTMPAGRQNEIGSWSRLSRVRSLVSASARLIRQAALHAPADVEELLTDLHVRASAGRARTVVLGHPQP
jgi:hypothetical protein